MKYVDAPKELIIILYLIILLHPTKICLEVRLQNGEHYFLPVQSDGVTIIPKVSFL